LVETTFLNDLWRTVMTGVTHLRVTSNSRPS
jgi:hypothetical protein